MILIENLSLGFGSQALFEGLDLSVANGEKIVISGKSGIGKSTILKAIMGFVPLRMGQITVAQNMLSAENVWSIRRQIAYVPQKIAFLYPDVEDGVRQIQHFSHMKDEKIFDEKLSYWLDVFKLPVAIMSKHFSDLSGGELQRIAIIFALLLDRKILLFDECTSSLDMEMKYQVASLFSKLEDITVLGISHDQIWHEYDRFHLASFEELLCNHVRKVKSNE